MLPFLAALDAGFVNWDDPAMLLSQTGYRGLGASQLTWMLTSTVKGHWSPLAWLSFALDYLLGGLEPRVYHATSLALHALNAALVCVVARHLLRPALAPRGGEGAVALGALGAALLFAVHPLRAETVAWISDRRDLLCAAFVLVSLWAYLRGVATDAPLAGGWRLASLAAFAAALASKGFALTLPLLLLVLDRYPLGRARLGWRALAWEKAPYAALALAGAALAATAVRSSATVADYAEYGPLARLGLIGYSLWIHPARFVWPGDLSPLYELPPEASLLGPRFLLPGLAAFAITVALARRRHRWPAAFTAWAVSGILLIPVSGIVLAGRHVAADRYTYLSGLGMTMLVAGLAVAGLAARRPAVRLAGGGVALALLIALGTQAWQQTRIWHDSEALWRHAIAVEPGCAACLNNLARALMRGDPAEPGGAARLGEAEAMLRRAVALRPDQPGPYRNLGAVLVMGRRWDEAEAVFTEVLRRWPISADGPAGLAAARQGRGDTAGAVALLRLALALEPDFTGARGELDRLERALDGRRAPEGAIR
jgi:protein O-mannosyl-transferase